MIVSLITGAGGFVGQYLTEHILKKGERVRAMVRRRSDNYIAPKLLELQKKYNLLDIVRGDVTDFNGIYEAMIGAHRVYHLASQSYVPDSVKHPSYSFQTNVLGISNILEAARLIRAYHSDNQRILFASSSEVYGIRPESELPLDENSKCEPASPYASSKLYGENLCRNYHNNYGIETIVTRAFNHEGVGRGHHFVTASIVRQLIMIRKGEKERLTLGDITPERDWTHVSDTVQAYVLAMEKGVPGETYVIGTGFSYSIKDFIESAAVWLDVPKYEIETKSTLLRPNDVPRLRANPIKIMSLGWYPRTTIGGIIGEMGQYYENMSPEERADIEKEIMV